MLMPNRRNKSTPVGMPLSPSSHLWFLVVKYAVFNFFVFSCGDRLKKSGFSITSKLSTLLFYPTAMWLTGFLFLLLPLNLSAVPKKAKNPPVDPTIVLAPPVPVKVGRGGACEVTVRAISSHGYDVEFEIDSGPSEGSAKVPRLDLRRKPSDPVSILYTHNGKKGIYEDSFRVKAKAGPHKAWGYANVTIRIEEPPERFKADPPSLDFGSVFLGESHTLPVRITNIGGGKLQGNLNVGAPWRLADPSDLALAEGETKEIFITFEPLSADTQRGSLTLDSKTKSSRKIPLQGSGKMSFEAPENAAFEQRVGVNELRVPIKNLTAAPLAINVHCPLPLKTSHSITLAAASSGDLVFTLPPEPFFEKNIRVELGDSASMRVISIALPPPPPRLEWDTPEKLQPPIATQGQVLSRTAILRNTGSEPVTVFLRPGSAGISLDPEQQNSWTIAPGESITVQVKWKLTVELGLSKGTIIAETEGLSPLEFSWEAFVQLRSPSGPTLGGCPPPPPPTPPATLLACYLYELKPHSFTIAWKLPPGQTPEFHVERPTRVRDTHGKLQVEWVRYPLAKIELRDGHGFARLKNLSASSFSTIRICGNPVPGWPGATSERLTICTLPSPPLQIPWWVWPSAIVLVLLVIRFLLRLSKRIHFSSRDPDINSRISKLEK